MTVDSMTKGKGPRPGSPGRPAPRAAHRRGPGYSRKLTLRSIARATSLEAGASASKLGNLAPSKRPPVTCSSLQREIFTALGWKH